LADFLFPADADTSKAWTMAYNKYPKTLTIAVTDRCNLNCWICQREFYESLIGGKGHFLAIENLYKLEKPIRHAKVISLTGFGETFLIPDLDRMCEYIFSINPERDLINIVTNGTLLCEKWGRLLSGHIQSLVISLNAASEETYDRFVRKSGFGPFLSGIREFMASLSESDRKKIIFTSVVHRGNMHEMTKAVDVVKDLGGTQLAFNQYQVNKDRREHVSHSLYFYQEEYNAMLDAAMARGREIGIAVHGAKFALDGGKSVKVKTYNADPQKCRSPFDEVIINADGRVVPCCYAGHYMGNAYEEDFDSIWFGEEYEKLRKSRWLPACKKCQPFVSFDSYHAHVASDLNRRKPEEVRLLFEEAGREIRRERCHALTKRSGFDVGLYEAKREEFGEDYARLLNQWAYTGCSADKTALDLCYEQTFRTRNPPPVEEAFIDLHGVFAGTDWGIAESNTHGQKWRWVGPGKTSNLLFRLSPGTNYAMDTLIHTAQGDSLWDIRVEVNGESAEAQRIVRVDDLFFHCCALPEKSIRKTGGMVNLVYRVDKPGQESPRANADSTEQPFLVALTHLHVRSERECDAVGCADSPGSAETT